MGVEVPSVLDRVVSTWRYLLAPLAESTRVEISKAPPLVGVWAAVQDVQVVESGEVLNLYETLVLVGLVYVGVKVCQAT